MNLLALDPANMCGWALYKNGKVTSGTWDLSPKKLVRYEGGGVRFYRMRNKINDIHKKSKLDCIAYEEVRRHLGTEAAHSYGGYRAAIGAWCEEQNPKVPYSVYSVSAIKRAAIGSGRASKEQITEAAEKKFKIKTKSDDQADALWILYLMCKEVGIEL